MKYSILIPTYNEEESIKELFAKVKKVMDMIAPKDYEILFINDGSTDKTLACIYGLKKKNSQVRVISFRRNCGKAAALSVGFEETIGKYIITMDADLQDEPQEIPKLIKKMEEGYDMVSGWKEDRQDPLDKTFPSKIFNWIVSHVTGIKFHDFNCGFKIYKREVVDELELYGQLYRFLPVLVHDRGFRIAEIKVKHNKRKYGRSKYTWTRFFAGIMDLFTVTFLVRYGKRPLHLFGFIGSFLFTIGMIIMAYLLVLKLQGHSIYRRPFLTLGSVLIIAGLQIAFSGLLAEMITKNSHSNKQYPILRDEA